MGLSAQDVHDMQFKLVRQSTGYDIDEVDAFLDQVEEEITRLTAELDAARALADAGLLVTPERDAGVIVGTLRAVADTFARFAKAAPTEQSRVGWESAQGVLLGMAELEAGESGGDA